MNPETSISEIKREAKESMEGFKEFCRWIIIHHPPDDPIREKAFDILKREFDADNEIYWAS